MKANAGSVAIARKRLGEARKGGQGRPCHPFGAVDFKLQAMTLNNPARRAR